MFGFYYALIGLFFGVLCSIKAKEMGISNSEWFTFGFAFNIPAYLILRIFASKANFFKGADFPLSRPEPGIN
jgi:hypothetical protein